MSDTETHQPFQHLLSLLSSNFSINIDWLSAHITMSSIINKVNERSKFQLLVAACCQSALQQDSIFFAVVHQNVKNGADICPRFYHTQKEFSHIVESLVGGCPYLYRSGFLLHNKK